MNTTFDKDLEALGVKEQFHNNVAADGRYPEYCLTVSAFIRSAFTWGEAPEGHTFWADIDDRAIGLPRNEEYPEEYYEYLSTL